MLHVKRFILPVCVGLLATGCRDFAPLAGPQAGRPSALARGPGAPVLYFSTYLGGSDDDDARGVAVDRDGFVYVTGETASPDFPATAGAFQTVRAGLNDVVVTKLDPSGAGLVYSTYLGGTSDDAGHAIAVDAAGAAYVAGRTSSEDLPTTAGVVQPTAGAITGTRVVGLVAKLDPSGSGLAYSTYLGGTADDEVDAIAVDAAGNAYVTGVTASADFPTTPGAVQAARDGQTDAFVTVLNAAASAMVYSTYLGGGSTEHGSGIAVDAAGHAYVTGRTTSTNFPTTPGAYQTTKTTGTQIHAAFVTKVNPGDSSLAYSTYLAGSGSDRGAAIALDASANAYITGRVSSLDFPVTPGAFQATLGGLRDAFVAKLDPTGSALLYSTYLGGADEDEGLSLAVDSTGSVYVAGLTASTNFPTTATAIQPLPAGLTEGFVSMLDPNGAALAYSTYLGGTGDDENTGIVTDATGSVYVIGTSESPDLRTTAGAFDTTYGGVDDMVVVKIADFGPPATITLAPAAATNAANTQHCVTASVQDAATNPVPGVPVRFSVTGAHSTAGAVKADANGQAAFCYAGVQAGDDTVTAVGDANGSGVQDPGEPSNTATTTWVVVGPPATLTLAPSAATNVVNTQHCVTATIQDAAAAPVPGVIVRFSVTGVHIIGGSARTDANGQAAFCYTGTQVGDDTISAFGDANGSGVQDPDEPSNTAAASWVPA